MLYIIAAFACLGGFLYGYDLGLISGALAPIKSDLHASEFSLEIMVGGAKAGALLGSFLGAACMLHYGRRLTIGFDSVFFVAGPLLMAFSNSIFGLTVGRVLVGMGIGVSAVVVPAYLGEVSPAKLRGRIVESYEVLLCLGMLAAMLVDAALQNVTYNWRWMVGAPLVPALVLGMALFVLPESPRWLVTRAKLDEALAVIHRVFTQSRLPAGSQNSTAEVEQELMELWSSVEKDKAAARERNLRAHEQTLAQKAAKGWRRLRLNGSKWHKLQSSEEHLGEGEEAGEKQQPHIEMSRDPQKDRVVEPAEVPHQADVAEENRFFGVIPAGTSQGTGLVLEDGEEGDRLQERRASGSLAGPSLGLREPHLKVAIIVPNAEEGAESGSQSGAKSVHLELADPKSPLYRSLSQIPDGLPPVRTKSEDGILLDSPSPPPLHRKNSLPKSVRKSALVPTKAKAGFWAVFWDMLLSIADVAKGEEREAFYIAVWLAFFNQAMASSAIINYAPHLLSETGIESDSAATLLTSTITGAKMSGVVLGVLLIDSLGRRPLLIWGSAACSASMLLLFGGVYMQSTAFELVAMCVFMLAFNASYAGVFWVLLSEIFSMPAKSPAASAATAMLFLAGTIADSIFLSLLSWLGPYCFFIYAGIACAGGIFSYIKVPETKGCTLAEVQDMLKGGRLANKAEVTAPLEPSATPQDLPVTPSQLNALLAAEEGLRSEDSRNRTPGSRSSR